MADHPTEQVDRVAQAIWRSGPFEIVPGLLWDDLITEHKDDYRAMACAALDAATPPEPEGFHAITCQCHMCAMRRAGSVGERDQ